MGRNLTGLVVLYDTRRDLCVVRTAILVITIRLMSQRGADLLSLPFSLLLFCKVT